jgi:SAM-dependent methyltransferase
MNQSFCPACGGTDLHLLVDFGELPSTGVFLSDPTHRYPRRKLSFNYCGSCAFITQIRSDTQDADYSEVGRGTQRQFPDYAETIVAQLRTLCANNANLLIEVGSNDGTFLTYLRDAGIKNAIGVEPSRSLANLCRRNGHRIENTPLDESAAQRIEVLHGLAKVVVCRHTLEHVPDPLSFAKALRCLLKPDGHLFIEVPSSAPIIDARLHGYELWDEHLSYFSETNLVCILERAGWAIRSIETLPHCGSENILCWAEPSDYKKDWTTTNSAAKDVEGCESFAIRWRSFSESLLEKINELPRPLYAMGASHPQTNFLHFTRIMETVEGLFDDDPFKLGKWVPANKPVPVLAGEKIGDHALGGTVMLTGFGYPKWMTSVQQSNVGMDICFLTCESSQA